MVEWFSELYRQFEYLSLFLAIFGKHVEGSNGCQKQKDLTVMPNSSLTLQSEGTNFFY